MAKTRMRIGASALVIIAMSSAVGCAGSAADENGADEEAIVGGKLAAAFQAVGYLSMDDDATGRNFMRFCTATLIAPNVVATAAHCVHEMKHQQKVTGPWMTFATGNATPLARRSTRVYSVYEHPSYNPMDPEYQTNNGSKYDFALLVLSNDVAGVTPAKVIAPNASRKHLAIGYGRTTTGAFDLAEQGLPQRKSMPMSILANETTPVFTKAEPTNKATDSTCYGDSGGALLEIDPTRPSAAVLVGVLAQLDTVDPAHTCVPGTRAGYSSPNAQQTLVDQVLAAARSH